jgi:hypothetical protein
MCQDHKGKWDLKCGLMLKVNSKMLNLCEVVVIKRVTILVWNCVMVCESLPIEMFQFVVGLNF